MSSSVFLSPEQQLIQEMLASQRVNSPVSTEPTPQQRFQDASGSRRQRLAELQASDGVRARLQREEGVETFGSQIEQDMATLSPGQLAAKYGQDVDAINQAMVAGRQMVRNLEAPVRSDIEAAGDTVVSAWRGFSDLVGGIGSLGAGFTIDPVFGTTIGQDLASVTNRASEFYSSFQSDSLQGERELARLRRQVNEDDNSRIMQEERDNGSSDFISGLRRIGRDALDGVSSVTENGEVLGDAAAGVLPSLFAAGPMSRAIAAAGRPAAVAAGRAGIATGLVSPANTILPRVAAALPFPAAVGLMEGGSGYVDASVRVMAMSHDELMEGSGAYRSLIENGVPEETARRQVAGMAARAAGAAQFAVGAATGKLVEPVEKSLSSIFRGGVVNAAAREATEEGIQGGAGTLASNAAVEAYADEGADILEGVGAAAGEGALLGSLTSGGLAAPAEALNAAVDTAKAGAELTMRGARAAAGPVKAGAQIAGAALSAATAPLWDAIAARADKIRQQNESESPVSDENVAKDIETASQFAPAMAATVRDAISETESTEEERREADLFVEKLSSSVAFDQSVVTDPRTPELIRQTLEGSRDNLDAARRLTALLESQPNGSQEQLVTLSYLNDLIGEGSALRENTLAGAIEKIPADHPAAQMVSLFERAVSGLMASTTVRSVIGKAKDLATAAMNAGAVRPIKPEEINTPEGDALVRSTIAVAETAPLESNPEANERILFHAERGDIDLAPAKRIALRGANILIQSQKEHLANLEALGLTSNNDIVSGEAVVRGADERHPSAAEHMSRIISAVQSGDKEALSAKLYHLSQFAQHMQNKVAALNEHLAVGKGNAREAVKYQALMPGGTIMRESSKGMWVNPYAAATVKNAQAVHADAQTIAKIANTMVELFPEAGVSPIEIVSLDASLLEGSAEDVVAAYKARRAGKAVDTVSETPATEAENISEKQDNLSIDEDSVVAETVDQTAPEGAAPEPAETGQPEGGDQSTEVEVKAEEPTPESTPDDVVETQPEVEPVEQETAPEIDPNVNDVIAALPEWSLFGRSFEAPKDAISRIFSAGLTKVREALRSSESIAAFTGSEIRRPFSSDTATAYAGYLAEADRLKNRLDAQLRQALSKKRGGVAVEDVLVKGAMITPAEGDPYSRDDLLRFYNFKALNLVEVTEEGQVGYNEDLLDAAVLAGLQWLLTSDQMVRNMTAEKVADTLKIESPSEDLVEFMNSGVSLEAAKQSLGSKIRSYWGVVEKADAYVGHSEGIVEAMASELLEAFVAEGVLEQNKMTIDRTVGLPDGEIRTLQNFVPITKKVAEDKRVSPLQDPTNPIYLMPDAIDQVALVEPEPFRYSVGEPIKYVPKTQLRNPLAKLSEQQKQAIRFEQDQPHYTNRPMKDFLLGLGEEGVLRLFGAGDLEGIPYHDVHRVSLEGKNASVRSAFRSIMQFDTEMRGHEELSGKDMTDIPVYFGYTFTRVGRMQMLGLNNPQANKLMREVVLPTKGTVDLSDPSSDIFGSFMLSLAQALGVKVHAVSREAARDSVMARLNGDLKGSVELFRSWLKDPSKPLSSQQVDLLVSELGSQAAPVAVHAVMEYARFLNSDAAGRKQFTTSLYVEADGVTNGPINAMQLLSVGRFTKDWLDNSRKGGLFIGGNATTMNEHRSTDKVDLYETSTNHMVGYLDEVRQAASETPELSTQMRALEYVMSEFLPDVQDDDDTILKFERGIAKNPLTITIYGSGERGIAGKVVDELVSQIYARMSEALQAQKADSSITDAESMFPNAADKQDALDRYKKTMLALGLLTRNVANVSDYKLALGKGTDNGLKGDTLQNMVLTQEGMKALRTNMQTLFVKPLREGIRDAVGANILGSGSGAANLGSADVLRMSVQVQSIFLQASYRRAVEAKLAEKAKDPAWRKDDFITRAEQQEILESLLPMGAVIETDTQSYFISGKDEARFPGRRFGSALSDGMKTDARIYGPGDVGVSGIPTLNIGFGDGMAMQIMSTMENAPDRTLKIFDGVHLPLDQLEIGSQKANEAIFRSWQGNPLSAVSRSYEAFLGALPDSLPDDFFTAQERKALTRAFDAVGTLPNNKGVLEWVRGLGPKVKRMGLEAEARHRAMAELSLSIDQMAAVGASYAHEGIDVSQMSDADILATLNKRAQEIYLELTGKKTEPVAEQEKPKKVPVLEQVGRKLKSGARVLSFTSLKRLASKMEMTPDQRVMFAEAVRSLSVKDYKVVVGNQAQLDEYARDHGQVLPAELGEKSGKTNGFILMGSRTIYVLDPTPETLLHELVHAATFDKVSAYYEGTDLGTNVVEVSRAIERIEQLMSQFLKLDLSQEDAQTQEAYLNTVGTIETYLGRGEPAAALNEFMAWGLSNNRLMALQKKTTASPLVRLVRGIVDGIKRLIWGAKRAPDVRDDMLSNLQFNTAIVMRNSRTPAQIFRETVLFSHQSYGTDSRLERINQVLSDKVVRYLSDKYRSTPEEARTIRIQKALSSLAASTDLSMSVMAAGFTMTPQQKTTFDLLIQVLGTAIQLDANALNKVQQLYTHVTSELTIDSFVPENATDLGAERYYSSRKMDVILGKDRVDTDTQGRSSILPVFLALSVTNDEFRAVLRKMGLPKADRKPGKTLDEKLENTANWLMDLLGEKVSGQGKGKNLEAVMDALVEKVLQTASDRKTMFEMLTDPLMGAVTSANDKLLSAVNEGSVVVARKADKVKASTDNKLTQTLASLTKGIAGIMNEQVGSTVAEGMQAAIDRTNLWAPLRELMTDFIGRTDGNADVYDMIKKVRNWIQQRRQQFREHLPQVIASKFSRQLTGEEWTQLFWAMGRTDIAALRDQFTDADILEIYQDSGRLESEIDALEEKIRGIDSGNAQIILEKAQQLAHFMMTGEPGHFLLRNAKAIADLVGMGVARPADTNALAGAVDALVTLYAISRLDDGSRDAASSLARSEAEGMIYVFNNLVGRRVDELAKGAGGNAVYNRFKGHMPVSNQPGLSLEIRSDDDHQEMVQKSFVRMGAYVGSSMDPWVRKSYYFAPVAKRAAFHQGIFQTVRVTSYGVDVDTGFSHEMTAGRITDPVKVKKIHRNIGREQNTPEPLVPVFDASGNVFAFERSVDPKMLANLNPETNLADLIGIWRGRQLEEIEAQEVNAMLIDNLHKMWERDLAANPAAKAEYVDLRDEKVLRADPVLRDAVQLLTPTAWEQITDKFGPKHFYVKRSLVNDAVGYREPSVGDLWTGTSRISPEVRKRLQDLALVAFGNRGYKWLTNSEAIIQKLVTDARVMIVVKSVVIPTTNLLANIYQLMARGVPPGSIVKHMPKKVAEVNSYLKSRLRLDEAEADLLAVGDDVFRRRKLEAEIRTIQDEHRRLSIWPLIQAGELSSISDGTITHDDLHMTEGRLSEYIEKKIDQLPPKIKTIARYGFISRDTALFQGLQRAVEYGDFLGKAILYEDLTVRQGKSPEYALGRITEEFVNYDRLPGRTRGYLENMGLLWFWNFKIRSTKVALSMIRNNPLHALMMMSAPAPDFIGTVGTPIEDNLVSKALSGDLGWSIGPGMGFRAPALHPWANMVG